MKLDEYQKSAMTTCTESSRNFAYMTYGLSAEVGEFMDKVAKAVRKDQIVMNDNRIRSVLNKDEEFADICKGMKAELGDCLWFIAGICSVCGWTLEEVAQYNLDKLVSRQKRGVIIGNGDNR